MIVDLTLERALYIAHNMVKDDFDEIMATHWGDTIDGFAEQCVAANGLNMCSLADDGTPVAMGGIALFQPKVGTAWMVGTSRMIEKKIEVTRFAKQAIHRSLQDGVVHRVNAFASALHLRTHPWLRSLGLIEENTLKKWGKNGEDFIIFAKVV